jgi:2'-5' RNA ligase
VTDRARLFVALALPPAVQEQLGGWAERALGADPVVRVLPSENLHVTLAFLGLRDTAQVAEIAVAAREAVTGMRAPLLTPSGLTGVPPRRPRLFAAEVDDEGGRAAAVAGAVARALAEQDLHEPEDRPFWPHITVARVRRGERPAAPSADDLPADAFETPEVVLYRSDPGPGGTRYSALASERLAT